MLRRFFKLIAGSLLTLVGIAIVIEAIRFKHPVGMTERNGWDPISEFLLCAGVVIGGFGATLAYSGWNPEAAAKFMKENFPSPGEQSEGLAPSPLAGEGRGEGEKPPFSSSVTSGRSASPVSPFSDRTPSGNEALTPDPSPLPEYRARELEQSPPSPDIGVQP